jgi:CHRD domain-containing protein
MGKSLRSVVLALVVLLLYASPTAANTEFKFTTRLDAVNPLTGTVTGDPDGKGKAEFTLDPDEGEICYELEAEEIAEPAEPAPGLGSAHIHFLGTGGISVDLEADFTPHKKDDFMASGCVEVDSDLILAILANPEQFYVNIHNVEFPGGALAGLLQV